MTKDEKPTPESIAAKVARALLRIPAPEKKPRKRKAKTGTAGRRK